MTTFMATTPTRPRPDSAKHVNYTYGMVLGVDDFTQEFAYLAGRDRALARAIGGYGTVAGLRVTYQGTYDGPDRGPRLSVTPGAALCPSGQLVQVTPAQCAYLVEWMAAHRAEVLAAMGAPPGAPPPPFGSFEAYVVLRYAECLTDDVPIPGEPCRSEDDLTAPSRVRDDFRLELRFTPPDQREEVAVRRFVDWLRRVPVVETGGSQLAEVLAAVRTASGVDAPPPADPCPPVEDFFADVPPAGLSLPRRGLADYRRALWRLWVTELLPCWRATDPGCGCSGAPTAAVPDTDCVLLAELSVEVRHDPVTDRLLLDGTDPVRIDEDRRPYLVNLRYLEEWALTEGSLPRVTFALGADEATAAGRTADDDAPVVVSAPSIVAGGRFDVDGGATASPYFSHGGLRPVPREDVPGVYDLHFDGYEPTGRYVVTGSVLVDDESAPHVLEILTGDRPAVRIRRANGRVLSHAGMDLQVTAYGSGESDTEGDR